MKRTTIRNLAAAAAIAAVSATGGAAAASASSGVVYSHTTSTKYVYNGRCIHTHSQTTRYEGWSSKAGRYIALVQPSETKSDSYRCQT